MCSENKTFSCNWRRRPWRKKTEPICNSMLDRMRGSEWRAQIRKNRLGETTDSLWSCFVHDKPSIYSCCQWPRHSQQNIILASRRFTPGNQTSHDQCDATDGICNQQPKHGRMKLHRVPKPKHFPSAESTQARLGRSFPLSQSMPDLGYTAGHAVFTVKWHFHGQTRFHGQLLPLPNAFSRSCVVLGHKIS